MKSLRLGLAHFLILAALVSCGKDNESGKSSGQYTNPYYLNQYGTISSPYSYGNISVNQIINSNPCVTSGYPNQARVQVQQPVSLQNVIPTGDIYAGVTSSGDVGLLVGQGSSQALFVAYLCQRGYSYNNGTVPQIVDLAYGSYSQCAFKPITRATLILPGAPSPLYFRWLDGGSSAGQKFPFCR